MSGEIELFDLGNVLVTNKSFHVCHRSIPLQSISDVEVIYHQRNWMPVVAPFVAALSLELAALSMHRSSLYVGVLALMLVTLVAFYKGGLRYTIALDTTAGHIRTMSSRDRIMIESLQQVLGTAVRRAHQEAAQASNQPPVFRVLAGKAQRRSETAAAAVSAGRPVLVVRKASQTVHPAAPMRSYAVGENSPRKLAAAGSSG